VPAAVRLAEAQIEGAGRLLARSFFHDPLAVYMLPDDAERARLLPGHFAPFIRHGHLCGEVYTTAALEGVAVWLPSAAAEITPPAAAASGLDQVEALLGRAAWSRFSQVMEHFAAVHQRAVPGPHWYLPLIGVEPSRHGRGLGSALLEAVTSRADGEGLPCYLETVGVATLPFYRRNGFHAVEEAVEARSGLRYWALKRDPATRK